MATMIEAIKDNGDERLACPRFTHRYESRISRERYDFDGRAYATFFSLSLPGAFRLPSHTRLVLANALIAPFFFS